MIGFIIAFAAAVIISAVFVVRRSVKTDEISLILKIAASIGFIMLGVAAFSASKAEVCIAIIPGLVFGLLGDFFLDMKYVYSGSEKLYTFAGFISFICEHIMYIWYLMKQFEIRSTAVIAAAVIAVLGGIVIYVTPKLMQLDYGCYRYISAGYASILIFVTAYSGLGYFMAGKAAPELIFFIGMILFLISDLILSQIYFGKDKNTLVNKAANHAFYYGAQILIAGSLIFIA